MITGVHMLYYSKQAESVRNFLRDKLGLSAVDAGGGWLIFGLPPAELGVHPEEGNPHHTLYLMCDDIHETIAELSAKGIEFCRTTEDEGWGLTSAIRLPDGEELGIYEPRHPTAIKQAGS